MLNLIFAEETEEAKTIADENTKEREETKEDLKSEVFAGDTKEEESVDNRSEVVTRSEMASQEGQRMQRQPSIVSITSETPETPMSIASTSKYFEFFKLESVLDKSRVT